MAAARILSQAERLAVDAAVPALLATQTRKSPTEAPQVEAVPDDRRAFAPRRQPQPVEREREREKTPHTHTHTERECIMHCVSSLVGQSRSRQRVHD